MSDWYRVAGWVGGRVAERRRSNAWTQEQLAEKLDVSVKYVQRIEAGTENLTIESIVNVATVLDVKPADLMKPLRAKKRKPGRPRKTKATVRART